MRTRALLFLIALLPGLAFAQGYKPGNNFTLQSGGKLCLNGAGCTAYIQYNTAGDTGINLIAPSGLFTSYGSFSNLLQLTGGATSTLSNQSTTLVEYGRQADGASSVGVQLGSGANFTTAGAKLASFANNIFNTPTEKAFVDKDGNFNGAGFGLSLVSSPSALGLVNSGSNIFVTAGGDGFNVNLRSSSGTIFSSSYQSGVRAPSFLPAKRTGTWQIAGASDTSFTVQSLPTLASVSGTPSSAAGTADAAYQMIKYASGAVSGNVGGIAEGVSVTQAAYKPRITIVFRTDSVNTSQKVFVGLAASDVSGVTTLAGLNTIRSALIRFDTNLGDTNFQCITSDGTTASATDSGVAFAINTTYTLTVDLFTSGHVYFTLATGATGTPESPTIDKSTNVPTGSTALGPQASITTLTSAARNIYLAHFQLDQN